MSYFKRIKSLLYCFFFNAKERIVHRFDENEKNLIIQTDLFPNNSPIYDSIEKSVRLVKYPPSSLILKEGSEGGDAIYIIKEGSIRVFTQDEKGNKIPLARLEQGAYFGEQTFLNVRNKKRSASIESITQVTLLRIDAKRLISILKKDAEFKEKVNVVGERQALSRHLALKGYEENEWIPALLKKETSHSENIQSYIIEMTDGKFDSFFIGQYVKILIKVGRFWLERPYTISDIPDENKLRITIKNQKSLFTNWLFHEAPNENRIFVTQPKGSFILNLDVDSDILCFAGGIGITPFLNFAKAFASKEKTDKKLHLIFTARREEDFIFKDEFNSIAANVHNFSICYRATDREGFLSQKEIIEIVESWNHPDIYICGPDAFVELLQDTLNSIRYPKNKIKMDAYVATGDK